MTDDAIATEPTEAAPAAPAAAETEAADPAPPTDLDAITRERDALQAKLKEQGRLLKELEQLKAAAKDREDAEKSELERATERSAEYERRYVELQQRHQETSLRLTTMAYAAQSGYRDPQDAVRLLDTTQVEYDDDGTPTNIPKLVADLLRAKPYLAASQRVPAGQGVRPGNGAENVGVGLASDDIATSMSMKSQRLAQVMNQRR